MRIDVDYQRCEGHALCVDQAPDVFGLDDDDELTYAFEGAEVPEGLRDVARAAAASCPVAALRAVP